MKTRVLEIAMALLLLYAGAVFMLSRSLTEQLSRKDSAFFPTMLKPEKGGLTLHGFFHSAEQTWVPTRLWLTHSGGGAFEERSRETGFIFHDPIRKPIPRESNVEELARAYVASLPEKDRCGLREPSFVHRGAIRNGARSQRITLGFEGVGVMRCRLAGDWRGRPHFGRCRCLNAR